MGEITSLEIKAAGKFAETSLDTAAADLIDVKADIGGAGDRVAPRGLRQARDICRRCDEWRKRCAENECGQDCGSSDHDTSPP